MKTRSSTKKNNPLILGLTFFILSSSVLAADKKPSDLITSPGDRAALERSFGPQWMDLVNSDPDRFYNGQNKGFLPANWRDLVDSSATSPVSSTVSTSSSTEKRPSDTVASFDRAFMEEKYGANWEELVNANPDEYTFSKGGKVPNDWLGRSLRPYGSVKPSDLITDSASIEALKEKFGDDWKKHVDLVPEGYLKYLPSDWADQIRKGKQTSSTVADNSPQPASPTPSTPSTTDKRPSDTVASFDRAFMEEKYGPNWEELVNANPDEYTFSKGGKVPNDWLGRSLRPYGSVKPSDLITDSASIEALKNKYGDDWKAHVDLVPEGFLNYLPSDWADQVRQGKQSSNVANNAQNANNTVSNYSAPNNETNGKDKKEDGGSIANQILALGTGIIGSNILISCKLGGTTPSIMAFGAGSLVYIASEIAGAKAQKSFLKVKKDEIEKLKAQMTQGGDLQRGIVEAKIKEEEDKLEFVRKRKKWTMAVTAMYGAATGLAAMELACVSNVLTVSACSNWIVAACEGGSSLPSSIAVRGAILGAYGFAVGNAGGTAMSRYGTALASGLAIVEPLNLKVAVAYQKPETRIATFGIGTALAASVMKDLSKVEKDLTSNINDLKRLLTDYDAKTQDAGGIKEGPQAIDLAKDNINLMQGAGNVKRMAIGDDLNKHCWGKDKQGAQTYSEEVCNNPLQLSKPKFDSKFSLPTLQSVANTGVDMAQAVARGDMGAADVAAGSLAANAMRVNEIKDKLLKDINEMEKKQGKKPTDFNKAIQDGLAALHRDLNKGMTNKGINLASIPSESTSLLDALKDEGKQEINTATGDAVGTPDVAASEAAMDINLDEGISGGVGLEGTASEIAAKHTLEDFETQESDILAQPETSIFKQLSNRYLLNYNRIFETKADPVSEAK